METNIFLLGGVPIVAGLVDQLLIALGHFLETYQIHRRGRLALALALALPCPGANKQTTPPPITTNRPSSGGLCGECPHRRTMYVGTQVVTGGRYITFPPAKQELVHLLTFPAQLSSPKQAFRSHHRSLRCRRRFSLFQQHSLFFPPPWYSTLTLYPHTTTYYTTR